MISELRKNHGDATVIAIMSGSLVERGSVAVINKYARAKCALSIGCDLVLSLPFPWCCASAEYFARAGVKIAGALAAAAPDDEHILAFGSESGDIDTVCLVGERLASADYRSRLASLPPSERTARGITSAYAKMYHDGTDELLSSPNNTLAVEYVRAIRELGAPLTPVTVKRLGAAHDSRSTACFPSASFVRELIYAGQDITGLVPDGVREVLVEELSLRGFASDEHADAALHGTLRMLSPDAADGFAECAGGVGRRLVTAAHSSGTLSDALALASTKQYTNARLRRAVKFAVLGITQDDLRALPEYTSVLAANSKGTSALKSLAQSEALTVLTKAADAKSKLSPTAKRQFDTDARADALYTLAFRPALPSDAFSRLSPTVVTDTKH